MQAILSFICKGFGKNLAILLCLAPAFVIAQTTVKGTVLDSLSKKPLPFATVVFEGTTIGTVTDGAGRFELSSPENHKLVKASFIGYRSRTKPVAPGKTQEIHFLLRPSSEELKEINITAKKQAYKNKGNPAVELAREVIARKDSNNHFSYPYYKAQKYEKKYLSFSNITERFINRPEFRRFRFVFDNVDTVKYLNIPIVTFYFKETISETRHRKSPPATKEVITGEKKTQTDLVMIDDAGIDKYFDYMALVNIYDDNILMLNNAFVSPTSTVAPLFYKFFIGDTLIENGEKVIELYFEPRNRTDFLYTGRMHVSTDGSYAVTWVELGIHREINMNWVNKLLVVQEFKKSDTGKYYLFKDEFFIDYSYMKNFTGVMSQRTTTYLNPEINQEMDDSLFAGVPLERLEAVTVKDEDFWSQNRHMDLSGAEKKVYQNIDSLNRNPGFRKLVRIIAMSMSQYIRTGPVEFGPFSNFYSINEIEGTRYRLGIRTTPEYSTRFNLSAYAAYGLGDKRTKYRLAGVYSLGKKGFNGFPIRAIKASYRSDITLPGQELTFVGQDNLLFSFGRGPMNRRLFSNSLLVDYLHEFENNFSFNIGYRNWEQAPLGILNFYMNQANDHFKIKEKLTTSEFSLTLRWAPGEKFYQARFGRRRIPNKSPIFTLRYIRGIKGLWGGEYDYSNLNANIYKRVYLSALGFTDLSLEAGKIFGSVPFPLLYLHRANQSYMFDPGAYNLMNFMEFMSDKYVSLHAEHILNGFLLNKAPLVKKLKFREILGFKILYGSIGTENQPNNTGLYQFPTSQEGSPISFSLAQAPYVEASAGISNVLKVWRFDVVRRFTYTHNPNVSPWGLRFGFRFDI